MAKGKAAKASGYSGSKGASDMGTAVKGKVKGGDPDMDWSGDGTANVRVSRLNAGGDAAWRGKRGSKKGRAIMHGKRGMY